ncbi:MAG: hypothetical protein NWE89_03125 [Candidatus Bathyarchaeota archaeon]|nr:hypothetical protein [Candidatus Bathyarchaeota archaeon]
MRVETLELNWFRGAGEKVKLGLESKNVVIFGDNGTGKSSFTDAFEYLLSRGRIDHLAHEYSKKDTNIRNTKAPLESETFVKFLFDSGEEATIYVSLDDKADFSNTSKKLLNQIRSWKVERHILRQHEVADFIKESKSKKYSILSPLIGLDYYENIASNIISLRKSVEKESKFDFLKGVKKTLESDFQSKLDSKDTQIIENKFNSKLQKYHVSPTGDLYSDSKLAQQALKDKRDELQPDISRYESLQKIRDINLDKELIDLIDKVEEEVDLGSSILSYQIRVLEYTHELIKIDKEIQYCPACGQAVESDKFSEHVLNEISNLHEYQEKRREIQAIKVKINSKIIRIQGEVKKLLEYKEWIGKRSKLNEILSKWTKLSIIEANENWKIEDVQQRQALWIDIHKIITEEYSTTPPSIDEIITDTAYFEISEKVPYYLKTSNNIKKIRTLISVLNNIHKKTREQISKITEKTLSEISEDVIKIWSMLHPGQPITDIRLIPTLDAEKAIDIALQFYGKSQLSPRLTLSEGYRNSLGLAIFISLANRGEMDNHPLVLDDIVSSLDRDHRGLVIDVLRKELPNRQVLLLTHDREWFDELRRRLTDSNQWKFFTLKPFVDPSIGIRISPYLDGFKEARNYLPDNPTEAGKKMRETMDDEFARIAEKLKLPMKFMRGAKNDYRTAPEFLVDLMSEAKTRLKIKKTSNYQTYQEALDCWDEAYEILITWSNRAVHPGIMTLPEANRALKIFMESINKLKCSNPDCETNVWRTVDGKKMYCKCRTLRWDQ